MRGSGGWLRQGRGTPGPLSYDAEVDVIMRLHQLQLIGLRRRFQAWQIPAVLRELQRQRDASLAALRARHAAQCCVERERVQRKRPFAPLIFG